MSFSKLRIWDNRDKKRVVIDPKTGRSWTRRIIWLVDEEDRIKLKFEDNDKYCEIIANYPDAAQTIWDRFKAGQSIEDSVSILGVEPPKFLKSRKG